MKYNLPVSKLNNIEMRPGRIKEMIQSLAHNKSQRSDDISVIICDDSIVLPYL